MSHLTFDSKDASGFDQILNRVRQLTIGLQEAIEVRQSSRPQQGRACLVNLHNRTRGIAAVLNEALGQSHDIDN
jgi:hypothetical protein